MTVRSNEQMESSTWSVVEFCFKYLVLPVMSFVTSLLLWDRKRQEKKMTDIENKFEAKFNDHEKRLSAQEISNAVLITKMDDIKEDTQEIKKELRQVFEKMNSK